MVSRAVSGTTARRDCDFLRRGGDGALSDVGMGVVVVVADIFVVARAFGLRTMMRGQGPLLLSLVVAVLAVTGLGDPKN